jgi:predicted nucleotidyltransferase component of viral defense system
VTSGLARSVQTRLVRHAHALGVDPNLVLARYATERLLYRLSRSQYVERFVLKGALMLLVWLGEAIRPTRDADLLGLGDLDVDALRTIMLEICALKVEPDGLEFDVASLRVAPIRIEDAYGGQRATLVARLGSGRLRVQVDIGTGDAVFPEPEWIDYPSLLDLPRPRIRAYRRETAIAEKVHAMVELGSKNSRMRDFFDIRALATAETFEGAVLSRAIESTFARRRTPLPGEIPLALTPAFAAIEGKGAQWSGFVRRLPRTSAPPDLEAVISDVAAFAGPVLLAAGRGEQFEKTWTPGGPWSHQRPTDTQ